MRVLLNQDVCMGCHLCEYHCAAAHLGGADPVKAFRTRDGRLPPRLHLEAVGPLSVLVACRHCEQPDCVAACLTGAMSQDAATGAVVHDASRCIGCYTCVLACPYGAVRPDLARHTVAKCDLCAARGAPACVANCPNEALVAEAV